MRPLCKCHGEPMYVFNDRGRKQARCRVKFRASVKRAQARYEPAKGYLTRRRRELLAQREVITNRLKESTEDGS